MNWKIATGAVILTATAAATLVYTFTFIAEGEGTQYLVAKANKPTSGYASRYSDRTTVLGTWDLLVSLKDGHRSRGTGGACLVEKLDDFGGGPHRCEVASQCTTLGLPGKPGTAGPGIIAPGTPSGLGWFAYCHENACWVKPPKGWCNRSVDYADGPQIWNLGRHKANIERPEAKSRTNWRVVTCLKKYDKDGFDRPTCGNPQDYVANWGPVYTVP